MAGRRRLTGVDWRQKIENQRGAVLATELKNNANKLARWTSAALVAGVDLIKLGYVARVHPRDKHHHVILSTQARAWRGPPWSRPGLPHRLPGSAMNCCERVSWLQVLELAEMECTLAGGSQ